MLGQVPISWASPSIKYPLIWSFISILMPIPLIKSNLGGRFPGYMVTAASGNSTHDPESELTCFHHPDWLWWSSCLNWCRTSSMFTHIQPNECMLRAFKSTKMKYIKILHATCLLSTVIFNAVKTLSFCPKPWIIVQQKYENRGQHCWDCCNPCCQWAPVWQLMWRHPPLCGIPVRKCFTFLSFSSKPASWNYSDYSDLLLQCISQDSPIFPISSTPGAASRTPYERVWCPPERSSKSRMKLSFLLRTARNLGFSHIMFGVEGPSRSWCWIELTYYGHL